jgi:hypothetical protein
MDMCGAACESVAIHRDLSTKKVEKPDFYEEKKPGVQEKLKLKSAPHSTSAAIEHAIQSVVYGLFFYLSLVNDLAADDCYIHLGFHD